MPVVEVVAVLWWFRELLVLLGVPAGVLLSVGSYELGWQRLPVVLIRLTSPYLCLSLSLSHSLLFMDGIIPARSSLLSPRDPLPPSFPLAGQGRLFRVPIV